MNLPARYKPRTLSDVFGQDAVVKKLRHWLKHPESCAFIFSGPTGIGKSCTADALCVELGILIEEDGMGGYYSIPSGRMLADHVLEAIAQLRFRPMMSRSPWRALICAECDRMTQSAETIWLDVLEKLPPNVVIIFSTNKPEALTDRFRGRCEFYSFESRSEKLKPAIQAVCNKVWIAELGDAVPPAFGSNIGMPSLGGPDCLHASIRAALQQLAPMIREAKEKLTATSPIATPVTCLLTSTAR